MEFFGNQLGESGQGVRSLPFYCEQQWKQHLVITNAIRQSLIGQREAASRDRDALNKVFSCRVVLDNGNTRISNCMEGICTFIAPNSASTELKSVILRACSSIW